MPAPNRSTPTTRRPGQEFRSLRLRMTGGARDDRLDGVWWPRTRDVVVELPDLVDHFPAERLGRVVRALVSPADWDDHPGHALVHNGIIKVGYLPSADDSHLVHLTTSHRTLLALLVVPPSFTRDQGDAALAAAVTHGDPRSASALIAQVLEGPHGRAPRSPTPPRTTRWSRRTSAQSPPSAQA